MWDLQNKEITAVLLLPTVKRYEYLLHKVVDQEQIWSLWDDGWVLFADDRGRPLIPVWPHPTYAALCATEDWADCEPRPVNLPELMSTWLPGVTRDGRAIAIFPTGNDAGGVIEPQVFLNDLRVELGKYE